MIETISEMWLLGPRHYIDNHPDFWPVCLFSFSLATQACAAPLLAWSAALLLEAPLDRMISRWRMRRGGDHDA